jgi:capsular polysaccharide export protein
MQLQERVLGDSATAVDQGRDTRGTANIAYLDPPYSRYLHGLAARLARRSGGTVLALLSSPAYAMYSCGDDHLVWPPGALPDPPAAPLGGEHALWSQEVGDVRFRAVFWHAVAWFRDCFRARGIRICLVFSDARPFSLAATIAAQECGVRCLYIERGAFRLRSASLSMQGLNARFSLEQARACEASIEGMSVDALHGARTQEPWLRLRFLRFLVANEAACRAAPRRRFLQHKRFALMPYLRLALAQWWTAHHSMRHADARLGLGAGGPVLLLPLQLPADSQVRLYSPFESNQALLDFVVTQARRAVPGVRVLVKRHPMDSARYRLPDGARWVGGNLARLYHYNPLVVCINSTVGFEAATRGVPVICFGPSFYTAAGGAVTLTTRDDFAAQLAARLGAPPDPARGRALLTDVLRWYQAPGDAWAYSEADLDATAGIALQHLQARALLCREESTRPQSRFAPEVAASHAARLARST